MGNSVRGTSCHHRQVHRDESHQRGHGEKMHAARCFVAAEQLAQQRELHRLPEHQAREHQQHRVDHHEQVSRALHCVVMAQVVMQEPSVKCGEHVGGDGARRQREELARQAPGAGVAQQVHQAVGGEQPHRREVPQDRASEPPAQRDSRGYLEIEKRRRVVNAPAAHGEDHYRDCIEPVRCPQPDWVDGPAVVGHANASIGIGTTRSRIGNDALCAVLELVRRDAANSYTLGHNSRPTADVRGSKLFLGQL